MGARELTSRAEIGAPPERVWDVLVDTARYPEWNPFIVEFDGGLSVEQDFRFRFRIPPAPPLPARGTIHVVTPGVELRWVGRLLWTWLFRAEHYHLMEPLEGGRTRFVHGEKFSGVLAVIIWPLLRRLARPVYPRFNQALGDRIRRLDHGSET